MTESSDTREAAAAAPSDAAVPPRGRFSQMLGPLNNRDYRLFLGGASALGVGVWIHLTTIGWLALEITDSSFYVSAINVAWFIPFFLFALPSGVIADRFDRRKVLFVVHGYAVVVLLVHMVLGFSDLISYPLLLVLTLAMGAVNALELPSRQAFLASLVSPRELVNAMALNASNSGIMRFLGPLLAGVLLDRIGAGAGFTVFFMAEVFFLTMIWRIDGGRKAPPKPGAVTQKPLAELKEGLRYVRNHREALSLVSLAISTGAFGWVYIALMPVMARDVLDGGPTTLGLLSMGVGLGSVPWSLFLAFKHNITHPARWLMIAVFSWGGLLMVFAMSDWLPVSIALLAGVGLAFTSQNILARSTLLQVVEPRFHGRVFGLLSLTWGANIFGTLAMGVVASTLGPQLAVGGSGLLIICSGAVVLAYNPRLIRM